MLLLCIPNVLFFIVKVFKLNHSVLYFELEHLVHHAVLGTPQLCSLAQQRIQDAVSDSAPLQHLVVLLRVDHLLLQVSVYISDVKAKCARHPLSWYVLQ